jgi:hypothetical protein
MHGDRSFRERVVAKKALCQQVARPLRKLHEDAVNVGRYIGRLTDGICCDPQHLLYEVLTALGLHGREKEFPQILCDNYARGLQEMAFHTLLQGQRRIALQNSAESLFGQILCVLPVAHVAIHKPIDAAYPIIIEDPADCAIRLQWHFIVPFGCVPRLFGLPVVSRGFLKFSLSLASDAVSLRVEMPCSATPAKEAQIRQFAGAPQIIPCAIAPA